MSQVDIYSLFGNALDNAIECLKGLPVEERHVKLQVKNIGDMVNIICENTCHTKLKFENGLPATTKDDTYNHGFGTKSIKSICKKYAAEFKMSANGEIFALSHEPCRRVHWKIDGVGLSKQMSRRDMKRSADPRLVEIKFWNV